MNDEKKPLTAGKKDQTKETHKPKKKAEKKASGNGFAYFFSFILFAITLAVMAFAYTLYNPKISQLKQSVVSLTEQLAGLKQNNQQAYLSAKIEQLSSGFKQLEERNAQLAKANSASLAKINQQIFLNKQSWLYSDIHYLLKLAVRRVNLVGDSKGAISALEAADDEIRKIENSALLDIRKTIFETIKNLQSVEEPDTEGLVLKVNYIKTLLLSDKVEQKTGLFSVTSKSNIQKSDTPKADLEQTVVQFFSQFFTVKNSISNKQKDEKKHQALLSKIMSEQVNALLLIEKVKHAVLSMNQEKFAYYTQKLFDVLVSKNTDIIIKNAVYELSSENVGIALPSASQPLVRYELVLEKMNEESQGVIK